MKETSREHYSYTVYANPDTARTFDDRRFGGPIGELIASSQATVLLDFVPNIRESSILDVGTGTGRAALLLAGGGAQVTGVDASEQMLAVARQRARERELPIVFDRGDAAHLQFADRAFDVVVSLRVLMHTPDWMNTLNELCRVAGRSVIFDYPSIHSAAVIQSLARRLLHAAGAATEPYRVFTDREIAGVLGRCGFRIRSVHRQFVLPIALHKAVGSRRFTEATERALERVGLLRILGSPVTLVADRCASS